ncbi:non-ribosomal peptide synthetase, partial [Bacillus wiedmannii]|uniref:non-ribosomal peptide synthetase n=1 Tax=Bacillus wiedmannii TaxID=1890302 RepID=UPI000BFACC2E
LQPERNQSVTPLFQTMFAFQSIKPTNLTLTDIELSSFELDTKLTKFDMSLNANEYNDLLLFEFQYNSDLFSSSTVKKMTNHYLNLLNSLVNNQYSSIASAQMLDESELKQLVVNWGPKPESSTNKIFYSYIDQYLENSPETVAVKWNNEEMTYRQLIYQSNKVANFLKDRKVPKGTPIGVSMEKSVILIPLVIGIMKAGCVYVPLEPTNAKERLSFIINDVGIELIFTQEKWAELFDSVNGIRVLSIDKEWCLIENKEIHLNNNVSLEDLAYILYTSGTTGTPKGVMITHKNIASAYPSWEKAYKLSSFKNCLQMASLAFDVFISDMVKTLCSGGTLVLCSKEDTIDPQALYGIMTKEKIHFAEFVPAVLKQFVSYLEQEGKKLEDLKLIISGSDTWYASDYKWIKSIVGADVKLINSYGITETTIDNIIFDESNLNINNEIVPIGRPFEHVGTYILDDNLQIVPIGVSGEIYISGPAVSAGYLNRDDLTLQRFIDNPYSEYKEHSILYKTGDQARYLSDGNIEFLGRKDKQIKIRGFRIEINEIEFILRQHKDVREGVVNLYNSTHLKDQLIAYVVLNKSGIQIDIKDYLKERLPHYMIPTHIIFLDKIPLNTNGKIDYNSLPKLQERIVNESLSTKTPVEEKISMIWKDLLGIEQIGANDNFFELGGHSLLATQVRSRMQTAFHINIPLRYLFEMPILKEIAIEVERLVIEQVESLTEKEIEELLALIK